MGYLVVVDRAYRGSVESRNCDVFLEIVALCQQVDPVDVVLRGSAVTVAVASPDDGPWLELDAAGPERLPHPRERVRALLTAGTAVYVDEPDLRDLGLDGDSLLPGVACLDTTGLAGRWGGYDQVWFL